MLYIYLCSFVTFSDLAWAAISTAAAQISDITTPENMGEAKGIKAAWGHTYS